MINSIAKHYIADGREACGFILKSGELVQVPNVAEDPYKDFMVSEADLEAYEADAIASWHTHPRTGCNLSVQDYATFLCFDDWDHYIFDGHRLAKYSVVEGHVLLSEVTTL